MCYNIINRQDNMKIDLRDLQNQHHNVSDAHTQQNNKSQQPNKLIAYAAPLVHDKVMALVEKIVNNNKKGKGLHVLVLGAGTGYFDQKLLDYGIKNVDAIEYIPEHYLIRGTRLYSYDLNNQWSHKLLSQNGNRKYDLIIAIEVVEHLENSFLLMREIKSVLGYSGEIIITSPNIESSFSRFRFATTGVLEYFGIAELNNTGHINPIISHIFKLNLQLSRLKLLHIDYNRNIWHSRLRESKILKKIIILLLYILARISIYRKRNEGEINIYHIININN